MARQHASGRRTVRERIERLFDPGSFHETGALAGIGEYDDDGELTGFTPANMVCGHGEIDGRPAAVQGDDFTVRGGAADAAIWQKMVYAERLAHDMRMPLVRLVDGEAKPVVAAAMGESPDKEALGGSRMQTRAGAVDNEAADEDDALAQLRRFLSYRRELEAAEDPVALRAEIEARLDAVRSPFRTAERFGVEEIVDPRDTRPLLCAWARQAHRLVAHEAGNRPKTRGPRP